MSTDPSMNATDAAGRMIDGPVTASTKLIDQYGVGKVLISFFIGVVLIIIFVAIAAVFYGGSIVRSDVLAVIKNKDDEHTEVVKKIADTHSTNVKRIIDSHSEYEKNRREDDKEREKMHREDQSKQWSQLKNISDSNNAQAATLQKATEIMTINGEVMKKSMQAIERSAATLEDNNALLRKIVEAKKNP